jgi:GNAT superfamily N-acetyltransferase
MTQLADGATGLRLATTGDRTEVRAFLSRLSPTTLQARYLIARPKLEGQVQEQETRRLLEGERSRHVVLLAKEADEIHGIGEFIVADSGETAELALVVEDGFQGRGIGQLLYSHLEKRARELGIAQFTGNVAYGNQRIVDWLRNSELPVRFKVEYAAMRFTLPIAS